LKRLARDSERRVAMKATLGRVAGLLTHRRGVSASAGRPEGQSQVVAGRQSGCLAGCQPEQSLCQNDLSARASERPRLSVSRSPTAPERADRWSGERARENRVGRKSALSALPGHEGMSKLRSATLTSDREPDYISLSTTRGQHSERRCIVSQVFAVSGETFPSPPRTITAGGLGRMQLVAAKKIAAWSAVRGSRLRPTRTRAGA
jgi:hypothetical protein